MKKTHMCWKYHFCVLAYKYMYEYTDNLFIREEFSEKSRIMNVDK